MCQIIITNHAYTRFKERIGINKKAANRLALIAYEQGLGMDDTSGRLCRYMKMKTQAYGRDNNYIKIYGEMVYCFLNKSDEAVLLTVMFIPSDLKNQAIDAQRKLNAA